MTPKEYLKQARCLDVRINNKLEQLESLNALAQKATSALNGMPRQLGRPNSGMADIIAKIVDLQEEIDKDIDMLIDLKRDILTAVNAVERLEYRLVLESRYLHFRTWQEIADTLGCNIRHIYRLHDAALKKIRVPPTCH